MIKLPGIDSINGIASGHKIASHGKDLVGVTACVKEMAHAFLHAGGLPGPVEQIGQACAYARGRRILSLDISSGLGAPISEAQLRIDLI